MQYVENHSKFGNPKKRYGAAHLICNLNYRLPNFIPIILDSLSSYDANFFCANCIRKKEIEVITQSKEKYISFIKHLYMDDYVGRDGIVKKVYLKMTFINSFKFLSASLFRDSIDFCYQDLFYGMGW